MPTKRVNKLVGKKTRNQVRDEALEVQHQRDEELLARKSRHDGAATAARDEVGTVVEDQATEAPGNEPAPEHGLSGVTVGQGSLAPAVTAAAATETVVAPAVSPEPEVTEWPVAEIPQPALAGTATVAQRVAQHPQAEVAPQAEAPSEDGTAADAGRHEQIAPEPERLSAPEEFTTADQTAPSAPEPAGEGSGMSSVPVALDGPVMTVADVASVKGLDRYADQRTRTRVTMDQIGISITPTVLAIARQAFVADKRTLGMMAPASFARWVQRAVHIHVHRTPEERTELARRFPESELQKLAPVPENKRSYNVPMPNDVHHQLRALESAETDAGRMTTKSGLIREAIAIEIAAAKLRAGGELPVLQGKLPHAR